jgi:hypothetical protein
VKYAPYHYLAAIFILGLIATTWHFANKPSNFKCPETYTTNDEYTVALRSYLNEEVANNPNITAEELTKKRYEALVDNNCTNTLQNLIDHLPVESGTTRDNIIKNEMKLYNTPE